MAKKKAPAALTGGRGFQFEDQVAASFLVDVLAGAAPLGPEIGTVVRLDWQTGERDGSLDDLAITLHASTGGERRMLTSIKSYRVVTRNGFRPSFVAPAWEQWRGAGSAEFRRGHDLLGLVVGQLAEGVRRDWDGLLMEALAMSPDRLEARLRPPATPEEGSTASASRRAMFDSLAGPAGQATRIEQAELLKHVRLLHFDFGAVPSTDAARAIERCQEILESQGRSEAERLWSRLEGVASSQRATGGTIDLPKLLAQLRGEFLLRGHPDYGADWDAIARRTGEEKGTVRTHLGGLATLLRIDVLARLTAACSRARVCLLVGDSGCGKTAVAWMLSQRYARVVWLSAENLEVPTLHELEQFLGIRHTLGAVAQAAPAPCLIVVDSPERCSDTGLQLLGRMIRHLQEAIVGEHVQVLITAQPDSVQVVVDQLDPLTEVGHAYQVVMMAGPAEEEVFAVLQHVPALPTFAVRHEIRPLLSNLKIVDWLLEASRTTEGAAAASPTGYAALIEWIWKRWIVPTERRLTRGEALKAIASLEADSLATGVPLAKLSPPQQELLGELIQIRAVRTQGERVFLVHDLLGDWARFRQLVGEPPTESSESRERASGLRWHRAVRLYGRYLLERNGGEAWKSVVSTIDSDNSPDRVLQDLLLDAALLSGSVPMLERAWSGLIAQEGRLLKRLLGRMEVVATVVVPDAAQTRLVRVPFPIYWIALIVLLEQHSDEVVAHCLSEAAEACHTWLLLTDSEEYRSYPGRAQAARLALRLARESQARRAEGTWWNADSAGWAYRAALLAAREVPDEVGQLFLELAERREPSTAIFERASRARALAAEASRAVERAEAQGLRERRRRLASHIPFGPLRAPWPDGPRKRVDDRVRDACLEHLAPLIDTRPDLAVEILLAVSIEEPRHEEPYHFSSRDDDCVETWPAGYPPIYFRGPFLSFLRRAPEQGLEFVLRLVNFATHRRAEQIERQSRRPPEYSLEFAVSSPVPVEVHLEEGVRLWHGDQRVFSWAQCPLDSNILGSALMALEKWLDEQLEAGIDISESIGRILNRSESVAFAGVLLALAKKHRSLLVGEARWLLGTPAFYTWDYNSASQCASGPPAMIGWNLRGGEAAELARQWHRAPHRALPLLELVPRELMASTDLHDHLANVRARWQEESRGQSSSAQLGPLIARLDPANYRRYPLEDGRVLIQLEWPPSLQPEIDAASAASAAQLDLMVFPFRCHQQLTGEAAIAEEELPAFWEKARDHEAALRTLAASESTERDWRLSALCGAIAVLLVRHSTWLRASPDRLDWCRRALSAVLELSIPSGKFDVPGSIVDWNWDLFLAEAGVALVAEDQTDPLGLRLVAGAVAGYHYRTTTRVMERAAAVRGQVGEVFGRMQSLAVQWSRLRAVLARCRSNARLARWHRARAELLRKFCSGELAGGVPLNDVSTRAARSIAIQEKRRRRSLGGAGPEVVVLDPDDYFPAGPGLDLEVLSAAFTWIDLEAALDARERRLYLAQLEALLAVALRMAPRARGGDRMPYEYDKWVFGTIARAVAGAENVEETRCLWQPLLERVEVAAQWVEPFLWEFFCRAADCDPARFVQHWSAMLRFALAQPHWQIAEQASPDLDDVVYELLGCHFGRDVVGRNLDFAEPLGAMEELFAAAAARWFYFPRVVQGFCELVVQPSFGRLVLPTVGWLDTALKNHRLLSHHRSEPLTEAAVGVLRTVWDRHRPGVSGSPEVRAAFVNVLTALRATGHSAAIELHESLIDSWAAG